MTVDLENPSDGRARDKFGRIWVTTPRGAAETGVTEAAIRDWTRRRLIEGQLVNGRRWYRLDQLQALEAAAYLRAQTRAAALVVDGQPAEPPQSDQPHHGPVLTDAAQKTCVIDTEDEGPCSRPVAEHARWNICDDHIADIFWAYRSLRRGANGNNEEYLRIVHRPEAETMRMRATPEYVYYVLFADRVKIGFTGDLDLRLANLPYDEVLAVEPGGRQLEQMRHVQFAVARIYANREWFVLTDELRSHCAMLVGHYGPPERYLRTAA